VGPINITECVTPPANPVTAILDERRMLCLFSAISAVQPTCLDSDADAQVLLLGNLCRVGVGMRGIWASAPTNRPIGLKLLPVPRDDFYVVRAPFYRMAAASR
jgi:hypothetical protein